MDLTCVIAAGGLGKRLQGFRDNDKTKVLLEVNNIPMICQQIKQINSWGLDRFIIITNPAFHSLIKDVTLLHFPNLNFDFVIQEEAKGISHALYQAKPYCENLEGKFLFVLGDNFFGENPLSTISSNDLLNNNGCQIYTVEVENPTEYGVAIVDNYSNVIENDKSYPGLQMKEIKPVMKLIIRGKKRQFLSAVGKSLNLLLPNEANTSSRSDQLTALWLSPDEWMIFSNEILKSDHNNYDVEKLLNKNICKTNLGAVTDVTDQFVLINLKGDKIFDLFETGSPFNFNDFKSKKGLVTQTILTKIDIIVHNQDINDVNLFVRRSFSDHLFSWMNDSASRL